MSEIEELEHRVQSLSPEEMSKFRAWFLEYDWRVWDQQIETDFKSGKLDRIISEAKTEFKAGKAREL